MRYIKGEFLAVRNIIGTEPQTRILWLTQTEANSDTYIFDYHDYVDPRCILTDMRLEKIKANKHPLHRSEQERTEVILRASIAAGKRGHLAPPTSQGNQNEEQIEVINLQPRQKRYQPKETMSTRNGPHKKTTPEAQRGEKHVERAQKILSTRQNKEALRYQPIRDVESVTLER